MKKSSSNGVVVIFYFRHLTPLHMSTQTMFQAFLETFLHTLNDRAIHMELAGRRNAPPKQDIVKFVFERVCYELERVSVKYFEYTPLTVPK